MNTEVDIRLLVCPACRGPLTRVSIAPEEVAGRLGEGSVEGLFCETEGRVYPVVSGVPYLIREAAFLRTAR